MYVWSLPLLLVVWMFEYVCHTWHEDDAQNVMARARGLEEEWLSDPNSVRAPTRKKKRENREQKWSNKKK